MGYAAEILGIFYFHWDYQTVDISKILKFLTWHGFGELGWNDPNVFVLYLGIWWHPEIWRCNSKTWFSQEQKKVLRWN